MMLLRRVGSETGVVTRSCKKTGQTLYHWRSTVKDNAFPPRSNSINIADAINGEQQRYVFDSPT